MARPVLLNLTATATEASVAKTGYGIILLKNDDTTNDLIIAFDKSTTNADNDYLVLKAGEAIEEWDAPVWSTLYYKSSTGSVAFRLYSELR